MRADRLLSILMLLQIHGRMTAGELARRLEVSERTILRDMEALSASGVPVLAERGTGGGWMLADGYQTRLTGLKQGEIQALFLAQPARLLRDLGLEQASENALVKLLAALPSMFRRDAEFVRQRIHFDMSGWQRAGESVEHLPLVQDAVLSERKLRFTYRRSDGTPSERLADPLGLVAKGAVWYLIAAVDGEVRTYRVSRIQGADLTEEPVTRPPGFDLAAYWQQAETSFVEQLPRYMASVRVAPDALPRLRWAGRFVRVEQVSPPDPDGWSQVTLRCETVREAREWVLSFGPLVEALEPAELRDEVVRLARDVLQLYSANRS